MQIGVSVPLDEFTANDAQRLLMYAQEVAHKQQLEAKRKGRSK